MGWGAGVVAALGLGRNIGPSKKDLEAYNDVQQRRVADAYKQGYEDARRQFVEYAKTLKSDLLNELGMVKSNYIVEVSEEPIYDFTSMQPILSTKKVYCQTITLCIRLRPDKKFMQVVTNPPNKPSEE